MNLDHELKRNTIFNKTVPNLDTNPYFSVIVLVDNTEARVERCIQSLVNQSFRDIEVICVNDSLSDRFLEIIQKYATNDSRIRILKNQKNLNRLTMRMRAAAFATGEYCLFVDADDFLDVNACQCLADLLKKSSVDLLQFTCGIEGHVQSKKSERFDGVAINQLDKKLMHNEILNAYFIDRTISDSFDGKVIKTNVVKLASESIKIEEQYPGSDIYLSFFIAYYAKSYQSIKTQPLYWHKKKSDGKTNSSIDLKNYAWYCSSSVFCADVLNFLTNKSDETKYHYVYEAISKRLLEDCCKILKNQISIKDTRQGASYLYNSWKDNPVFDHIVKQFFEVSTEEFYRRWVDQKYFVKLSTRYQNEVPFVSVIVPVYNCEQYIKECLDSVVLQNKIPFEVICIDDGSTDNSLEVIKSYQKNHDCISIISKPNEGLSVARNTGLMYAHGIYVQFLDSDDMLETGALDRLYQVSKELDLDVLFFNAKTIYDNESLRNSFPQYNTYYVTKADLSHPSRGLDLLVSMQEHGEYRAPVWQQFYKRSFMLEKGLVFERYILHEDNLFTFLCLCKANLAARINEGLYCRRIRQDSIMTSTVKFKNVYGYLRCYMGMLKQILSMDNLSEKQERFMIYTLKPIGRAVITNYKKLDINEQKKVLSLTPAEFYIFSQLNSQFQNEAMGKEKYVKKLNQKENKEISTAMHHKTKNLLKATLVHYKAEGFASTVCKIFRYLKSRV